MGRYSAGRKWTMRLRCAHHARANRGASACNAVPSARNARSNRVAHARNAHSKRAQRGFQARATRVPSALKARHRRIPSAFQARSTRVPSASRVRSKRVPRVRAPSAEPCSHAARMRSEPATGSALSPLVSAMTGTVFASAIHTDRHSKADVLYQGGRDGHLLPLLPQATDYQAVSISLFGPVSRFRPT